MIGKYEAIDNILTHMNENDPAFFAIIHKDGEWSISYEFGREAPDSPMIGGASYSIEPNLTDALAQVAKEVSHD